MHGARARDGAEYLPGHTGREVRAAVVVRARVRAPELVGNGGWINTGGQDLTVVDLRGTCVILDFWASIRE
ncbi:hypothetical protein SAMN05216252_123109 [Actinacidiphila glaucinigra]|uniref:Uncharacterized protein n=1 Tax=Actinacidiphila glaucinigra TaxID=235986 RepID=A0A239MA68_9ACTN|nr:hypothetical protein SAMN05216252_123109 [Actinacidiphila glaucinigra]